MNMADAHAITAIITNAMPENGDWIREEEIKPLIEAEVKVSNWEEVQKVYGYLRVIGSIEKMGTIDAKYRRAPVRRIHK